MCVFGPYLDEKLRGRTMKVKMRIVVRGAIHFHTNHFNTFFHMVSHFILQTHHHRSPCVTEKLILFCQYKLEILQINLTKDQVSCYG